jgi:uncharacterized protein YndB with AHSA1/START domain
MSQARSRKGAAETALKPGSELTFEAGADGPGLPDWFGSPGRINAKAAAFDTRLGGPAVITGRAPPARRVCHGGVARNQRPFQELVAGQLGRIVAAQPGRKRLSRERQRARAAC